MLRGRVHPARLNEGALKVSRRLTKRSLAIAKANAQAGVDAALTIAAAEFGVIGSAEAQAGKARLAQRPIGPCTGISVSITTVRNFRLLA